MLGVWGGTAAAAIGLWPRDELKAAAVEPDTRTPNQRAFDIAFGAYDYDQEVEGAAALHEIEALGAQLEVSDPRHTDIALLKVLALPPEESLPQLERLIREQHNGTAYDIASIAGIFVQVATRDSQTKSLGEQIASLRGALERVSLLWPANVQVMVPYRLQLAEMIAKTGNTEATLSELRALSAALADAKAPAALLATAIHAEAWYSIELQRAPQAVALLEKAMAAETKTMREELAATYAWALVFAGDTGPAEREMRIAAYAPQRPSTFLQNALGRKPAPKLGRPLDLAYAMIKANKTAEAADLIAKEAPWACRTTPAPWIGPWHERRERAVRAAYEAVCPKEAKRAEAGG
jgi:hypothetical protein